MCREPEDWAGSWELHQQHQAVDTQLPRALHPANDAASHLMSLCALPLNSSHLLGCLWRREGVCSRRGSFSPVWAESVGVCLHSRAHAILTPPAEMMIHAGSRLHICLLGGCGRGRRLSACERGEGCLQNCAGVMGTAVTADCPQRQREADYKAGSRGPGCGCEKLHAYTLGCQSGDVGCPGDWAGKRAGLANSSNAAKKI